MKAPGWIRELPASHVILVEDAAEACGMSRREFWKMYQGTYGMHITIGSCNEFGLVGDTVFAGDVVSFLRSDVPELRPENVIAGGEPLPSAQRPIERKEIYHGR